MISRICKWAVGKIFESLFAELDRLTAEVESIETRLAESERTIEGYVAILDQRDSLDGRT